MQGGHAHECFSMGKRGKQPLANHTLPDSQSFPVVVFRRDHYLWVAVIGLYDVLVGLGNVGRSARSQAVTDLSEGKLPLVIPESSFAEVNQSGNDVFLIMIQHPQYLFLVL